ncbi:DNA-binding protein HU [Thiomonas sp. CB3]|nr:DNA-binding protein HU [Thiomonas sp. CB3]
MNKSELIDNIATRASLNKREAEAALSALVETIHAELFHGRAVRVAGLGEFAPRDVPERTKRNPRTGEEITVPAHVKPTWKASKTLKDHLHTT